MGRLIAKANSGSVKLAALVLIAALLVLVWAVGSVPERQWQRRWRRSLDEARIEAGLARLTGE
jgi:hypothetical protein